MVDGAQLPELLCKRTGNSAAAGGVVIKRIEKQALNGQSRYDRQLSTGLIN